MRVVPDAKTVGPVSQDTKELFDAPSEQANPLHFEQKKQCIAML